MSLIVASGLTLGALGIASATALDVAIDRTGHSHASLAYRMGSLPTKALAYGGIGLLAAGVGAMLIPQARPTGETLAKVGVGAIAAWGATLGVRLGVGMLFHPAGRGMRFNPGDIALNAIDRTHMMGRLSKPHEIKHLGRVSELQGHGGYAERLARGDFVPVWKPGDPPPGFAQPAAAADAASAASVGPAMSRS